MRIGDGLCAVRIRLLLDRKEKSLGNEERRVVTHEALALHKPTPTVQSRDFTSACPGSPRQDGTLRSGSEKTPEGQHMAHYTSNVLTLANMTTIA